MAMPEDSDPLDQLKDAQHKPSGARVEFQSQLDACDRKLVAITRDLADAVGPVTTAFVEGDAHGAQRATEIDASIDERCRELEEACYVLIARQAPVARDLRHLVALLRSVADVQRSGTLLRHVAESLTWLHPPSLSGEVRQLITQLGDVGGGILQGAATAWEHHDGLAATELERSDDEADLLQKCLLTDIYTGQSSAEEAVTLALLGRYYERIADHGVEVARQVTYFLTGERLRDADEDSATDGSE